MVSRLLAVKCGNTRILQVSADFEMSMDTVMLSMKNGNPIEVAVDGLDEPYVKIEKLKLGQDEWKVPHVVGEIAGDGGSVVNATLYDNPLEANPLNLR